MRDDEKNKEISTQFVKNLPKKNKSNNFFCLFFKNYNFFFKKNEIFIGPQPESDRSLPIDQSNL